jgi:hypothetical protein
VARDEAGEAGIAPYLIHSSTHSYYHLERIGGLGPYMTVNGVIQRLRPGILRSTGQIHCTKQAMLLYHCERTDDLGQLLYRRLQVRFPASSRLWPPESL